MTKRNTSHLKKALDASPQIAYPHFLLENLGYECIMGSNAYGVASDNSDLDMYGFTIPGLDDLYPYRQNNYVYNFDHVPSTFEQFQKHHIKVNETEYDFAIYNIAKYMKLVSENNPNMIDSIFVPDECVTFISDAGKMIRDSKHLFLSREAYHKFKGYAFAQLKKLEGKNAHSPTRKESVSKYGYDVKYAYHLVRLLGECEQILRDGNLDLRKDSERLKAIRRGEWTLEQVRNYFEKKESSLESLYEKTNLRSQQEATLNAKVLLLNAIEHTYGSMGGMESADNTKALIHDMRILLKKYDS